MNMFRQAHDPWWDLEGQGAKRSRIHHKIVADIAFALAIVACGSRPPLPGCSRSGRSWRTFGLG